MARDTPPTSIYDLDYEEGKGTSESIVGNCMGLECNYNGWEVIGMKTEVIAWAVGECNYFQLITPHKL